MKLENGSHVGVIGGGPAGSFFSYFLLKFAQRLGLDLDVQIHEARDFSLTGPKGCNMCGGVVSETLVENLAAEGINLPATVVQRGIDSYYLHTDVGSVRIETPLQEMRIAAVHRGAGPRGTPDTMRFRGLDEHLLERAQAQGARLVRKRVDGIGWEDGRPQLKTQDGSLATYDLLAVAVGVNAAAEKLFVGSRLAYQPPRSTKTYICELYLGQETVQEHMGNSMHVFLLNIPRLEFAALIPKGDYVTLCLLGREIDKPLIEAFLNAPEVRGTLPAGWKTPLDFCHCSPRISIQGAAHAYADRLVFVGDCGVARLYKDGIGSAYRTAKAAAITALFEGISAQDFRRHYGSACQHIRRDNRIGKLIFAVTRQIQKREFLRRGVLRMVGNEQRKEGSHRRMSMVLWDTFTGSAPYTDVLLRSLHPFFLGRLAWDIAAGGWSRRTPIRRGDTP